LSNTRQPEVDFLKYLGRDFDQIFGQIVSMREKTLGKTNLVASSHIERKNAFPVGVRRSKTSFANTKIYREETGERKRQYTRLYFRVIPTV